MPINNESVDKEIENTLANSSVIRSPVRLGTNSNSAFAVDMKNKRLALSTMPRDLSSRTILSTPSRKSAEPNYYAKFSPIAEPLSEQRTTNDNDALFSQFTRELSQTLDAIINPTTSLNATKRNRQDDISIGDFENKKTKKHSKKISSRTKIRQWLQQSLKTTSELTSTALQPTQCYGQFNHSVDAERDTMSTKNENNDNYPAKRARKAMQDFDSSEDNNPDQTNFMPRFKAYSNTGKSKQTAQDEDDNHLATIKKHRRDDSGSEEDLTPTHSTRRMFKTARGLNTIN